MDYIWGLIQTLILLGAGWFAYIKMVTTLVTHTARTPRTPRTADPTPPNPNPWRPWEQGVNAEVRVEPRRQAEQEEFPGEEFIVDIDEIDIDEEDAFLAEAIRGITYESGYAQGVVETARYIQHYGGLDVAPPPVAYRDLPPIPQNNNNINNNNMDYVPLPEVMHFGRWARRVEREGDYEQL
jgi:hypothetical protein